MILLNNVVEIFDLTDLDANVVLSVVTFDGSVANFRGAPLWRMIGRIGLGGGGRR